MRKVVGIWKNVEPVEELWTETIGCGLCSDVAFLVGAKSYKVQQESIKLLILSISQDLSLVSCYEDIDSQT